MIFITNFNNSRELSEIKRIFDSNSSTSLDVLLDSFVAATVNWSVPKESLPGDIVVFMCAKTARANLGLATSHIPANYSQKFRDFVNKQKAQYKKYSGHLLGCGIIASVPVYDNGMGYWMADIDQLHPFMTPIYIDDFRSFISVSKTNSITYLNNEQWERLKWTINQKNLGFFKNVTAPDIKALEGEFIEAVKKEGKKSLDVLKKEAVKKESIPVVSTVQTKAYQRNPTIAAYVKKRANGRCQLCGHSAPFYDPSGEPYLECHHIEWLSKGGMDSVDNCVALCPNCHRKMHLVNDPADKMTLKAKNS